MRKKLKDYLEELMEEYYSCILIDEELTEARSDNYYYHTRATTLLEVITDLYGIINE